MFFDKNYIELICSPDILVDEHHEMSIEETISWFEELGFRYEYEERAAILEYDGGLTREAADRQAFEEISNQLNMLRGDQHE